MKLMAEIDTANAAEARLLAKFLLDLATLADASVSINHDSEECEIPLHPLTDGGTHQIPVAPVTGLHAPPMTDQLATSAAQPAFVSNVVPIKPELPVPPAPPGPPAAPEYDANGMPWDARIHSGNKAKTIKGEWKYRRGVDDAIKTQVEASLPRGAVTVAAGTTANIAPAMPLPPMMPIPPPFSPMGKTSVDGKELHSGDSIADEIARMNAGIAAAAATPPPPASMPTVTEDDDVEPEPETAPAVAAPAPAAPAMDFATLVVKVGEAIASGATSMAKVAEVLKPHGLDNLFGLSARPELIPLVAPSLGVAA